jgi:hypothetical protein
MTEAAAAPEDVDDPVVEAQLPDRPHAHRGERLVDLPEVHVVDAEPRPPERLGDHLGRGEARLGRRHADGRPRPHDREGLEACGLGNGPVDDDEGRGAVVAARRVARRDAEPLDLGVQDLQRRELLVARVAPRVLVDREGRRRAVAPRHLDRHDLVGEGAGVDGGDRPLVRPARPRVLLLAGDAGLHGGVPADRDGHVLARGVGRLRVAGRRPGVPLVGAGHRPVEARRQRRRLDATGDDGPVHARPHGRRRRRDRGEAAGAVPVVSQPGHVVEAGLDGGVAGDVAAAVARLAHHDVVDRCGIEPGAPQGLADDRRGQRERVGVDQRPLVRGADGGAGRRHDPGVTHGRPSYRLVGKPRSMALVSGSGHRDVTTLGRV